MVGRAKLIINISIQLIIGVKMNNILSTSGVLWATNALNGGGGYFSGTDLLTGGGL